MKTNDLPERDRWARLRFSIIGPLLACPAEPKQLGAAFAALAAKAWRHPVTGLDVRFGASTLERWYYAARRSADPVAAHFSDRGHPFHVDRGHRFTLIADGVQRVRVTGFIVSQVSAMAVKPPVLSTPARSAGVGNSAPKAMFG